MVEKGKNENSNTKKTDVFKVRSLALARNKLYFLIFFIRLLCDVFVLKESIYDSWSVN